MEAFTIELHRVIDGKWVDERISEPVSGVVELLQEKKDRALTQKWAVWLVKRDPGLGIKVRVSPVYGLGSASLILLLLAIDTQGYRKTEREA